MHWEAVFPFISGYEWVGGQLRLYVDGPSPEPSFTRSRGVRTPLFRLFAGREAESVKSWLGRNRAWQCLRVPPDYGTERGIRAVLVAADWHAGEASALFKFARTRTIRGEADRGRLRREVRLLIEMVMENPIREGEFDQLQLLEDVINTAPFGVELATALQMVDAHFGDVG